MKALRDRAGDPSGRREIAGDAAHRQNFPTHADGPHTRPERRHTKAFGQRRARLAMFRIATAHAPNRKPWYVVSMGHYYCNLVLGERINSPRNGSDAGARNIDKPQWLHESNKSIQLASVSDDFEDE